MKSIPTADPNAPVNVEKALEETSDEPRLERTNHMLFLVGGGCAAVIITAALILFFVSQGDKKQVTAPTTKIATQVSAPPAETPTPPPKSEIRFEVLNGSGVAGSAAKAAAKLTARGYTVITIGNVPENIEKSEVFFAEHIETEAVLADLKKEFGVTTSSGVLREGTASARLVIGKK